MAESIREMPDAAREKIFRLAFGVTGLGVFGASAISPVLPDIAAQFGVDAGQTSGLVGWFILPMALLSLPLGALANRFSLKPVLIACLLLYGAAGLACALAPDFATLLAFRILQGCGAAALELFGLVILIEAAEPAKLHDAIGRNAGVIGLSTALAPVLSGLLALASWRASFLPALLGLPLAFAIWRGLPELARPAPTPVAALRDFVARRAVIASLFATLLIFLFLFCALLSFAPEKATRLGVNSSLVIALIPMASAIMIGVSAPRMGGLLGRWGGRNLMSAAYGLYGAAMLAFALAPHFIVLVIGAALLGAAHGLLFPLIQTILARQAPHEGSVMFMALNVATIGVGQTVAPLIMSGLFDAFGLNAVFYAGAGVAAAMIFAARLMFSAKDV